MRQNEFPVDAQFTGRWSTRAYDSSRVIGETELMPLFEAARWAPSSSNEQPWKFYYPKNAESRVRFNGFVNEHNRTWAVRAGLIVIVCARKTFAASGNPNPHAWYDTGAAVMSFMLQAEKGGLRTRQMAGILRETIQAELGIDTQAEDIICAVALGVAGDAAHLNEKHRAQESPNNRKKVAEFAFAV